MWRTIFSFLSVFYYVACVFDFRFRLYIPLCRVIIFVRIQPSCTIPPNFSHTRHRSRPRPPPPTYPTSSDWNSRCVDDILAQKAGKTSDLLLSRALHVLTLQLHGLDRPQQQPYQQPGKGSCSSGSIEAPVNAGGVEETKGGGGIRGGCPLVSGFSQSAYFAAVLEESSKASDSGKAGAELRGRGRGLLGELGGGDVGGGGSLCEVLGKVAVDHGALGALFEDGLQVCFCAFMGVCVSVCVHGSKCVRVCALVIVCKCESGV